jgi:hypothetical protein
MNLPLPNPPPGLNPPPLFGNAIMLGPQSAAGKQRSCGDTCFILSYEIILEL